MIRKQPRTIPEEEKRHQKTETEAALKNRCLPLQINKHEEPSEIFRNCENKKKINKKPRTATHS